MYICAEATRITLHKYVSKLTTGFVQISIIFIDFVYQSLAYNALCNFLIIVILTTYPSCMSMTHLILVFGIVLQSAMFISLLLGNPHGNQEQATSR